MQMVLMNYRLAKVETLFVTTNPTYSFLSSSLVKEIAGRTAATSRAWCLKRYSAASRPVSRGGVARHELGIVLARRYANPSVKQSPRR